MQMRLGSVAALFLLTQFALGHFSVFFSVFFLVPALFGCWFITAAPATYKQVVVYS